MYATHAFNKRDERTWWISDSDGRNKRRVTLAQYLDFLPGGEAHRGIRSLTSFYAGGEYDMELQLILKREEVPPCELNAAEGPRLGWTSWVKNESFPRDPSETILEL